MMLIYLLKHRSLGYIQPFQQSTSIQNSSAEVKIEADRERTQAVASGVRETPTIPVPPVTLSTPPLPVQLWSTPVSALTAISESRTDFTAAWNQLTLDTSWISTASKTEWLSRIGANDVEALEFLTDQEINELEGLLTVVPFRRFKKYMGR
jgi:hypothetical protein